MKKALLIILIFFLLGTSVSALENEIEIPKEYENIKDFVPEDIFDLLPENIFSSDIDEMTSAANEFTSFEYLLNTVSEFLNLEIKNSINLLIALVSSIMLSSVISSLNSNTLGGSGIDICEFVSNVFIVSILISYNDDIFSCSKVFFERIDLFMVGLLPFMCTLTAMGGGVASAVATNFGINTFLAISEFVLSKSVFPIAGACISLSSISAIGESGAGSSLLKGLKRIYVFMIGMLMTLILFVFSSKGIMANSTDTLSGRAIKFAAGNFIPIVGSNIGDILKGVGNGIEYLKNTVGVISVLIIFLILLPGLVTITVRRLILSSCAFLAEFLGAKEQGRIVNEFSSVYGVILAVMSMSSVLFIAAVIISVRIGNAMH